MDDQNEQAVVALDQALLRALADPAEEPAFVHRLLHSNLYVLGQVEDAQIEEDGTVWPRDSSTMRIAHFDVDGETVLPVFSAPDHLQGLFDEMPALILLRATNLLTSATPDVKIVLNPGTAVGRAFTYEDIQKLLS